MKKIILTLTFVLTSVSVFAQKTITFAVPFLTIPSSPNSMAMGNTSLVSQNDPMMVQYNPANVVDFENSFQYTSNTENMIWLPSFGNDMSFFSFGLNASYNISDFTNGIPLYISAGYLRTKFDRGNSIWRNDSNVELGTSEDFDSNNKFTIGIGFDYLIKTSLGFSINHISSKLSRINEETNKIQSPVETINAFDFGFKTTFPIVDISEKLLNQKIEFTHDLYPVLDLTIGGSFLNYGKEIKYVDENQGDPLPRSSRLGYSFKFGLDYQFEKSRINLAEATITREVYDYLIQYNSTQDSTPSKLSYQNIPGDIKFFDNFVLGNSNSDIFFVQAYEIGFAETFYLKGGNFIGEGYPQHVLTEGYSLTTKGLTKFINETEDLDLILSYFINHIEIQYFSVKYGVGYFNFDGTRSSSISLTFKGF